MLTAKELIEQLQALYPETIVYWVNHDAEANWNEDV